jgi:hypothetical protein
VTFPEAASSAPGRHGALRHVCFAVDAVDAVDAVEVRQERAENSATIAFSFETASGQF